MNEKVEFKPTICVVLPNYAAIDELLALKRVMIDHGRRCHLCLAFCAVNVPDPEHYEKWAKKCSPRVDPILVDVGDRYHNWFRSAAEMQKSASPVDGRIYNQLVELVSENNKTGSLKDHPLALPLWLRQVYQIMGAGEYSQEVVVDHMMGVINSFFWTQIKRDWKQLFNNPEYASLREVWDGFNENGNTPKPFTLPDYFQRMFMRTTKTAKEIMEAVSWWTTRHDRFKARMDEAFKKQYLPVQTFNVGAKRGCVIHIRGYFESRAAIYQLLGSGKFAVGIIRNHRGQACIMSSIRHPGADFSELFKALRLEEPTLWYHETRFTNQILMNGSDQYTETPGTAKSDDELVKLICQKVGSKNGQVAARASSPTSNHTDRERHERPSVKLGDVVDPNKLTPAIVSTPKAEAATEPEVIPAGVGESETVPEVPPTAAENTEPVTLAHALFSAVLKAALDEPNTWKANGNEGGVVTLLEVLEADSTESEVLGRFSPQLGDDTDKATELLQRDITMQDPEAIRLELLEAVASSHASAFAAVVDAANPTPTNDFASAMSALHVRPINGADE